MDLGVDDAAIGFTALTLILSLQASYAAPLILLAQNRQDDRDRVQIEQDRQRSERNLNDTEYLAREVVALRLAMQDMATKDFIRAELRSLLEELDRPDPTPKKARPDWTAMAEPTRNAAAMMIGPRTTKRTCRPRIRRFPRPATRAAST